MLRQFLNAAYMPSWLQWGFWVSPLTYGEIGLTVNEFLAPRWGKVIKYYSLFFCEVVIFGPGIFPRLNLEYLVSLCFSKIT